MFIICKKTLIIQRNHYFWTDSYFWIICHFVGYTQYRLCLSEQNSWIRSSLRLFNGLLITCVKITRLDRRRLQVRIWRTINAITNKCIAWTYVLTLKIILTQLRYTSVNSIENFDILSNFFFISKNISIQMIYFGCWSCTFFSIIFKVGHLFPPLDPLYHFNTHQRHTRIHLEHLSYCLFFGFPLLLVFFTYIFFVILTLFSLRHIITISIYSPAFYQLLEPLIHFFSFWILII